MEINILMTNNAWDFIFFLYIKLWSRWSGPIFWYNKLLALFLNKMKCRCFLWDLMVFKELEKPPAFHFLLYFYTHLGYNLKKKSCKNIGINKIFLVGMYMRVVSTYLQNYLALSIHFALFFSIFWPTVLHTYFAPP